MSSLLYEGKSKIIYHGPENGTLIMSYKDTTTAFNAGKKEELLGKGKLNAAISNIIYDYLAENGVETHLVKPIDDITVLIKETDIVMVEVILRNISAGSFSKKYGVLEGVKLNNTVIEFSLKNDSLGDPMINKSQIIAIGLATAEELEELIRQTLHINKLLSALFLKANIELVDFKLEFGRYKGRIILCDEISPDSCRLWDISTGKKLDKDRFRQNLENVIDSYQEVLRRLQNVQQI